MNIMDGKKLAKKILNEVKEEVSKKDQKITLGIISVGDDSASQIYIKQKIKTAAKLGIETKVKHHPEKTALEEVKKTIEDLNSDQTITGFILQLPLPKHLENHKHELINLIEPSKDIDGLTFINQGKLFNNDKTGVQSATPKGIISLLNEYEVEANGKNCVVIGSSNLVGKPTAMLLEQMGGTVTICNSKTKELASHTLIADIIVSAAGVQDLITEDMVREGVVVVDVGISRTGDGLTGDIDFENVSKKCKLITPVPGGVGPMTVASLMQNLLVAHELQNN